MPSPHAKTRPNTPRRVTVALAAAVALMTAAGCSTASATSPAVTGNPNIVVAAVPASGATGLYIAADRGLFSQTGLHVTISSAFSAATTVTALLQGKVDVTLGQWTTAIALEAAGKPLRALASGNSGGPGLEEVVTARDSQVTTVAGLKGKTIAVNVLNGLSQDMAENVLIAAGMPVSQVHWAVMPFPAMGTAVAQGQVAAAFMVEPYTSEAEERYGLTALADPNQGATQNLPITGYFTTRTWFNSHPAAARAFIGALEQGEQIAATDRAAVEQALIRHLHVTPETAAIMSLGTFPQGVDPVQLARVGDLMQTHGQLPNSVNVPAIAVALTK
jgi:NitT/TauT family transport system substrate-binding protein